MRRVQQALITARDWLMAPEPAPPAPPMPGQSLHRAVVTPAQAAEQQTTEPPEQRGAIRPTTCESTSAPPPPADACRHCSHPSEGHGIRYAALAGWHDHEAPVDFQQIGMGRPLREGGAR